MGYAPVLANRRCSVAKVNVLGPFPTGHLIH